MTSFTFSVEQVRSAPPEVRRWFEREITATLAALSKSEHDASQVHAAALAACIPEEAAQIFEVIKGNLLLSQVLFELARETPNSQSAAPLYPISIADILRHTRLGDGDRLVDCFTAINHAFQSIRNDPEATLFGFDQYGHVFIHQTTHNSIRQLWEQLYASHAPTVGGPPAGEGAALAGFNPPHLGLSEDYRPDEHRDSAFQYGQDIGVTAFVHLSWALWHRGYPDQSARAADRALAYSRELGDAHTLAHALALAGRAAVFARDVATAYAHSNECVALASEHGFAQLAAVGRILQGWADAQRGEATTGIARIRAGLAAAAATGTRQNTPLYLALLAEALALAGKIEEGLAALDDALAKAAVSGAKGWNAEIHRLRGELTGRLPHPDPAKAEESFRTALAIAREQGTRGYELRAATSLARLWREQTRRAEAHELLAPVYGSFTEGFDTADLKEAKGLLDELASVAGYGLSRFAECSTLALFR